MDIFRPRLDWAAPLLRTNHVRTLMPCHREKGTRTVFLVFSSPALRFSFLNCYLHRDYTVNVWVPPPSLPPYCPLDWCQAREQIGSRHGSVPKYSGKESKEHICWVQTRAEMSWCLKGRTGEESSVKQGWRHRESWDDERCGIHTQSDAAMKTDRAARRKCN